MEIVFETHSVTTDNERGIATGWNGGELSAEGRRLAAELGERYRAEPPSVVYSSDLRRAIETSEIAFGGKGIPVTYDPRLRECDYGAMTGMPVEQLHAERARRIDTPFPRGESYTQVVERTSAFLTDARENGADATVVVIGHSATKWALDFIILGVPLESSFALPFDWQPGWRYILA